MELVAYLERTKEVGYRCNICNKVSIENYENKNIFETLNPYMCTLKNGEKLICSQCGNIHTSETPLIKNNEPEQVRCPKCRSNQIQIVKRGWKVTTGFLGSSKNERVCLNCKHKF